VGKNGADIRDQWEDFEFEITVLNDGELKPRDSRRQTTIALAVMVAFPDPAHPE